MLWAWLSYILWGLFPAFFPLLKPAAPLEILAHRFVWTLAFMLLVLLLRHRLRELRQIPARTWLLVSAAALFIAANWGTYIVAVNTDHVADAALGYFMNPLVNVALGMIFLGERLRPLQWGAVIIAAGGVVYLTIQLGHPPLISLTLAFSFAFYGLIKKRVNVGPLISLTAETTVLFPVALGYLFYLHQQGRSTFETMGPDHSLLLMSAGVVTAVPLLLFGRGAKEVTLSTLGMMQYLTPTMQMLWAVFVKHEPLASYQWIGFIVIWIAVGLFIIDTVSNDMRRRHNLRRARRALNAQNLPSATDPDAAAGLASSDPILEHRDQK